MDQDDLLLLTHAAASLQLAQWLLLLNDLLLEEHESRAAAVGLLDNTASGDERTRPVIEAARLRRPTTMVCPPQRIRRRDWRWDEVVNV